MNKKIGIILAVLIVALFIYKPAQAATNALAQSVQDLGVSEGQSVTNGFVFIDGKYIEPPYIVSRNGVGICINGHLVEQPCPWPIPEKKKVETPKEDPKMPKTITKSTSMYDKDLVEYMGTKRNYNSSRLQGKNFANAMVKAYAELPCVKDAKPGLDDKHIDVTWQDGQMDHIRIVPFTRKPTEWTRESVLERLEKDRANYEDRLNKGDYYFLGIAHGRMTGSIGGAKTVLPVLLSALKTSKDAKELRQQLQQAGIGFMDEACEAFFNNRLVSKQLEERVNALTKNEIGVSSSQSSTNESTRISR